MTQVRPDIGGLHIELSGDGPPVLLIHGAGAFARILDPVAQALLPTHRVLGYDRRGFSRSKHPPVQRLQTHVEDALALIEGPLGGRAHVLGWSAGANIALMLAAAHPDRVASVVVCEPSLLLRVPRLETIGALVRWESKRLRGDGEAAAAIFYRWVSQYRGTARNAFDEYPKAWQDILLGNHAALFVEARIGSGAGGEFLGPRTLARIGCAVHVLRGASSAAPFQAGLDRIERQMPRARHSVIDGASHMVPTDAPEAVAAAVREFAAKD